MKRSFLLLLAVFLVRSAVAQLVTGVVDRTIYTDSATFTVPTEAGFQYAVALNGIPITAGEPHTVSVMDYYELIAQRTPLGSATVITQTVKFIVVSSRRGDPENGLIEWTPFPLTPSAADEFSAARLTLVLPRNYPPDLEIPVVAWIDNGPGNARRVNGSIQSSAYPKSPLLLRRGVGHTFLAPGTNAQTVNYDARIQTLQTNRSVTIDAAPGWQTVSGSLPANANWPQNSRIHVVGSISIAFGNTLAIEAGTVVWLDPAVNIANSGHILVNGTLDNPVVFTPSARVAPEQHAGAWGGLIMRGAGAALTANGAIFTGSGAAASFSFAPGASHRSEQALLVVQSGAKAFLTNCFIINQAGQIGNGYNSDVVYDHCLLQRAITGGEYEGGSVTVNNSAIIEFPAIDGVVSAQIADADYDAIYFTTGTHLLKDSLVGFAKDDAIDSGSGGAGTVVVTNCWVESALHEALAWSGGGRQTWSYDSVLINCGQGLECGWSSGADSPICYGERLLSTGNSIGARYGDNYTGTTGLGLKTGFLTVTNSLLIHNYRDVFGRCWDDTWAYRDSRMDIRSNYLSAPNPHHPDNLIWDGSADTARLNSFMRTPLNAKVGVGFANWTPLSVASLSHGIPIRLSTFTPHPVSVDYQIEAPSRPIGNGTLHFAPGETVGRILATAELPTNEPVRVVLSNAAGAEITTDMQQLILPASATVEPVPLVRFHSNWRYLDDGSDQGTAWRAPAFDDTSWQQGPGQLGFGDNDEATQLRRVGTNGSTTTTFYFRQTFTVTDPVTWTELQMRLLRDDAGIVYVNGLERFRSPNLPPNPAVIDSTTRATSTGENSIDTATIPVTALRVGDNTIAVEIHQESTTSSDVSFDLELMAIPATEIRLGIAQFGSESLLYWTDPGLHLESNGDLSDLNGWKPLAGSSPFTIQTLGARQFYRLRR